MSDRFIPPFDFKAVFLDPWQNDAGGYIWIVLMGFLVILTCGLVGKFIVVRRMALVGDAIDDILDITNDLKEILWRFDRFGADDAHWYFRMLYQIHWGEHLRGLAGYLYWRLRDENH